MSSVVEGDFRKTMIWQKLVESWGMQQQIKQIYFKKWFPSLELHHYSIEALEKMRGYVVFMKDTVTKKRLMSFEDDDRMHHFSVISIRSLVQKKEDPTPSLYHVR